MFEEAAAIKRREAPHRALRQREMNREKVRTAIQSLRVQGMAISQTRICQAAQIDRLTLKQDPVLYFMVADAVATEEAEQWRANAEAEAQLIAQVKTALNDFNIRDKRPSTYKISEHLNIPLHRLRKSEAALRLIREARASYK